MVDIGFNQADLIKSIALFYLLTCTSFILEILTCAQRHIIQHNKYIQYCISFCIFYFLVTLVTNSLNLPPIEQLLYAVFYFILFMITTRLDFYIMAIILLLTFIIYFIEINKEYYLKFDSNTYWITLNKLNINLGKVTKEQLKVLTQVETILYYLICIFLVIGLISYRGELKALSNGKSISVYNLLIDTHNCDLKYKKSIFEYFKIGLTF